MMAEDHVENATPSSKNVHLTRLGRQKYNPFVKKGIEHATLSQENAHLTRSGRQKYNPFDKKGHPTPRSTDEKPSARSAAEMASKLFEMRPSGAQK